MKNKKGFTLIELIVVIAIIAVLSGIILFSVTLYINKGKDYYQANIDMPKTFEFFQKADVLIEKIIDYINS